MCYCASVCALRLACKILYMCLPHAYVQNSPRPPPPSTLTRQGEAIAMHVPCCPHLHGVLVCDAEGEAVVHDGDLHHHVAVQLRR